MCHTNTGKSMLRIGICFCMFFFCYSLVSFVCSVYCYFHSSIHVIHIDYYGEYCFLLSVFFRYEWNEVVFVHTGILIHFCPISRLHWCSTLICAMYAHFFYSFFHSFFLMNCKNMCEWILKASNNNADRSTKNMALILSELWVYMYIFEIAHPLGIDGMHLQEKKRIFHCRYISTKWIALEFPIF